MATNPIGPDAGVVTLPGAMPAMPAVSRILARYDRSKVEAFVSVAIDLLDVLDGDSDLEPSGDEQDGSFAEDEEAARLARAGDGPGCIVADPDAAVDDGGCDDINDDREQEEPLYPVYGIDQTKAPEGTAYAEAADRALMRPHRDRIRRTRCERREIRGWNGELVQVEYRLKGGDA